MLTAIFKEHNVPDFRTNFTIFTLAERTEICYNNLIKLKKFV